MVNFREKSHRMKKMSQRELSNYESEVLDKIKKEEMLDYVYSAEKDHLGDYIDDVIERSLYIYKNK